MSNRIHIRPLQAEQWPLYKAMRITALADAPYAFSSTLAEALERSDAVWASLVKGYTTDPNSITCIAYFDDVPCGMAACALLGEETEMFAVWVDPKYRRKGIGRGLIIFALRWSKAQGVQKMTVGVYNDNLEAVALYQSAGFMDHGRIKPDLTVLDRKVIMLEMDITELGNDREQ